MTILFHYVCTFSVSPEVAANASERSPPEVDSKTAKIVLFIKPDAHEERNLVEREANFERLRG